MNRERDEWRINYELFVHHLIKQRGVIRRDRQRVEKKFVNGSFAVKFLLQIFTEEFFFFQLC